MLTKFGVKEALKAGVFARTVEQKETVFAMLGLMGVPIVLKEQAKKLKVKLTKKIEKKSNGVVKAEKALNTALFDRKILEIDREGTGNLVEDWNI
jgi:hypothetical protein